MTEKCALCGREAEDVTFDFLGPDPNDIDGEYWDFVCGTDKGCNSEESLRAASGVQQP